MAAAVAAREGIGGMVLSAFIMHPDFPFLFGSYPFLVLASLFETVSLELASKVFRVRLNPWPPGRS